MIFMDPGMDLQVIFNFENVSYFRIFFLNFLIFTDHHAPLFKREHDYYPYNTLTVDYAMQYWHQKGTYSLLNMRQLHILFN